MTDDAQPAVAASDQTGEVAAVRPEFDMPRSAWLAAFRSIAAGNFDALDVLYRLSARRLFGLALWHTQSKEDAAEVVQETFVRVAEHRDRLGGVADPRSWLLAVAHRIAIDVTRRRKVRATEAIDEMPFLAAPEDDVDRKMDAARLSALLAKLPPAQRDVIYLHHFAGCTFAVIGDITGVPTFTAASRYRLGMRNLRRFLEVRR